MQEPSISGTGTRFMWIPTKGALRAGYTTGAWWWGSNVGDYSVAAGYNCIATGTGSAAFGVSNISGDYSFSAGRLNLAMGVNSASIGYLNIANGQYSVVLGANNAISNNGLCAFSAGSDNSCGNAYSSALGSSNFSNGMASVALGQRNFALGDYSFTAGNSNTANGLSSMALGQNNYALGDYSFIAGFSNTASEQYSSALGYNCKAAGTSSFSVGDGSLALGERSFALGHSAQALDIDCYAIGDGAVAMGNGSGIYHEGDYKGDNLAIGHAAWAEGYRNNAIGFFAKAVGCFSTAIGNNVSTNSCTGSCIIGDLLNHNDYLDCTSSIDDYPFLGDISNYPEVGSYSDHNNQMTMRFTGDKNSIDKNNACFRLETSADYIPPTQQQKGAYLYHNSQDWEIVSDSNRKTNIIPVNIDSVLNKICNVQISTWKWKPDTLYSHNSAHSILSIDSMSYTCLGPMAQDFYREFPIGIPDSSMLSVAVMRGVTFAGVQALKKITDSIETRGFNYWSKSGDSISLGQFIGTTDSLPLIFKINSNERMRIENNQMSFLSNGSSGDTAFKFFSDASSIPGAFMYYGISGWNTPSDRNLKDDFKNIEGYNILQSISRIPITTWIYKKGLANARYIGPMAQDFYNEFKFGLDSLSINSIVFDGINLAGIKALIGKTDSLQYQIDNKVSYDKFSLFQDTLKCLSDACTKIQNLENQIISMQKKLDSLTAISTDTTKRNQFLIPTYQNLNFDEIILDQNNPNPFAENCQINYYIPSKYAGNSKLVLTDEVGIRKLNEVDVCLGKPCQITISAKDLISGVYVYALEINGRIVKAKKMMVIK